MVRTLYDACLQRLGLSKPAAAELHGSVRLDTVKSWANGRREPSPRAWEDLRVYAAQIQERSDVMAEILAQGIAAAGDVPQTIDVKVSGDRDMMALAAFALSADVDPAAIAVALDEHSPYDA